MSKTLYIGIGAAVATYAVVKYFKEVKYKDYVLPVAALGGALAVGKFSEATSLKKAIDAVDKVRNIQR